jgi:hypothetical protein
MNLLELEHGTLSGSTWRPTGVLYVNPSAVLTVRPADREAAYSLVLVTLGTERVTYTCVGTPSALAASWATAASTEPPTQPA